ncbi:MAG TPA: molybdenum ABC transporter ATP-binding protein [Terriglobales bacterium]|nr:molybdenum ABC transporter ATP-binding protein [Terriglobales bacterium]
MARLVGCLGFLGDGKAMVPLIESHITQTAPLVDRADVLWARIYKRIFEEPGFVLDVDVALVPGFTIVFGPSGAGKTTLLDSIAGLGKPDIGRIAIGDKIFFDSEGGTEMPVELRRIGYVLQDLALFPHMTAEENVAYGLEGLPRGERKRRTAEILESFRIAHLAPRKPAEISGGERQRVALARALVIVPRVLLLDEPLAGLDAATKSKIIGDLRAWNDEHRIPVVYVTHHRDEVFALGERVIVLEEGRIAAQGTPHEVMTAPRQEMVAQLAGFENIFEAVVEVLDEGRGTMTCRIADSRVELETPLVRAEVGSHVRIGIRAGDILLATVEPYNLSARNVIPGRIVSLDERDVIVSAKVDCGVEMEVHLTLAARDALELHPGGEVWLILKTHSCHLMVG